MAEAVSNGEPKPAPKRRRILDPSEVVPVPVYSSKVSSSLNLKTAAASFIKGDNTDSGADDGLWREFPSRLKPAPATTPSDSEDDSEDDSDLDRYRDTEVVEERAYSDDPRCPTPPPPESPVQKQSRRVAEKIDEVNRKLQAVSSILSPEPAQRRSRRRQTRVSPPAVVHLDDDDDVVVITSTTPLSCSDSVREIPLKVRCRTDVHKIPVLSSTPLSEVVTQLSVMLDVPPPRLLLLKEEAELPTDSTIRELGLGIADIIECVVMAAEETSSDVISVRLQSSDRASSQQFSISRDAPLSSVFSRYLSGTAARAQRKVCFLFDGARLTGGQTPAQLDMEDGDIIEVWT